MSASKHRTDWAMLLLRLAVGGMAVMHGVELLRHTRVAPTFESAFRLGSAILEVACGGLMIVGVWMVAACIGLLAVIAWPLVFSGLRGLPMLAQPSTIFRALVTLAAGVGGAGKWGLGK